MGWQNRVFNALGDIRTSIVRLRKRRFATDKLDVLDASLDRILECARSGQGADEIICKCIDLIAGSVALW